MGDGDPVEALVARARREVEEGRLPSCQLALARDGQVVLDETIGAPSTSLYHVYSVTKALMAGAMWALIGDGEVQESTRAAEVIPGFGANGKDPINVEHLMTHTAGLARAPMPLEVAADPEQRLRRFVEWYPRATPGEAYEYHAQSAHWVLAEIITRVTGMHHGAFAAERVATRVGVEGFRIGVPIDDQEGIRQVVAVGDPPEQQVIEVEGVGTIDLAAAVGEAKVDFLLRYNEPWVRVLGPPGGGGVASAVDVVRYFQALLHDEHAVFDSSVLADGIGRIRVVLPDPHLRHPANRTLGLVVAGDDGNAVLRSFGFAAGPRAFGSPGAGGQIAWADPDTGVSFCYLTDGLELNPITSAVRGVELSTLAAAV